LDVQKIIISIACEQAPGLEEHSKFDSNADVFVARNAHLALQGASQKNEEF